MGRFISSADVRVIRAEWWEDADGDLPPEEVTIRKFTWADEQRFADAMLQLSIQESGADLQELNESHLRVTGFKLAAMNEEILNAGIKSWTLRDGQGRIMPLRRHIIARLTPEDAEFILDEIAKFNPRMRSDDRKFRPGETEEVA